MCETGQTQIRGRQNDGGYQKMYCYVSVKVTDKYI